MLSLFSTSTVASVYRIFDESLLSDPDFMAGWRLWSFHKTHKGELNTAEVKRTDRGLIVQMRQKGRELNDAAYADWNRFRSALLAIFPNINSKLHYHDQYRHIFKRVAFVVVDCCFAIKFQMNSKVLRALLVSMFKATGSEEVPEYFILLDNHITDSDFNHKLNQFGRQEYRGTQDKVLDYRSFNPKLSTDGIAKMRVPFIVAHNAMNTSEKKVRRKMADGKSKKQFSRAGINDFSLLYLMDKIRRSFGLCARMALLTDDFGLLHYASTFYNGSVSVGMSALEMNSVYPDLPPDYVEHYIVTPQLLSKDDWNEWRREHVYPFFATHIADA